MGLDGGDGHISVSGKGSHMRVRESENEWDGGVLGRERAWWGD